jgi:hypothetical protein
MMISITKRKGWYPQVKYVGPFFTATANMKSGMSATEPDCPSPTTSLLYRTLNRNLPRRTRPSQKIYTKPYKSLSPTMKGSPKMDVPLLLDYLIPTPKSPNHYGKDWKIDSKVSMRYFSKLSLEAD